MLIRKPARFRAARAVTALLTLALLVTAFAAVAVTWTPTMGLLR